MPEPREEAGAVTTGWVGTVVQLDTWVVALTAGCLLPGRTEGQEVEWLVDTRALGSLLSRREWERIKGTKELRTRL